MDFSNFIRRLEVPHDPGLTHAQLLLTVRFRLQVELSKFNSFVERGLASSARRTSHMGGLEFRRLLGG